MIMPAASPLTPSAADRGFGRGTGAGSVIVTVSGTATVVGVVIVSGAARVVVSVAASEVAEVAVAIALPEEAGVAAVVIMPAELALATITAARGFEEDGSVGVTSGTATAIVGLL
jgi:hypothetical protein